MTEKECVICGKRFMARMETQKVCGDECRAEKDRRESRARMQKLREHKEQEEIACVSCGKVFKPKNSVQKYCSPACLIEADKLRRKKTKAAAEERQKAGRVCPACGKRFTEYHGKQKVCGNYDCSRLADRARRNKRTIEEQAAWEKEQAAQEKPKPTPKHRKLSPLAQTVAEARAHGLSYGQYVAKYITPGRELHKAERAVKKEGNKAERAKAEARALELEHEIEVIRRTL